MDQRIIDLYDDFTHGGMTRRRFLDRLAEMAGSAAAAIALLPLLQNDYARAAIVAADDARLATERASYESPKGKIDGYLARPKAGGKRPAVLVIHENRGLNPHLEDVARRFATEGFLAYAVDLLSLVGGTPASEDLARDLHTRMNQDDAVAALAAAVSFLKQHPESTGKVGAVGFCFGGLMVNRLAVASPQLDAGVAYYGRQVTADQVPAIRAARETNLDMVAQYDAKNREALIRLKAAGVQFHKFSDNIMQASYKAANAMYEEEAAKNAKFKAIYEPWKKFRAEEAQWFALTESAMDAFLSTNL